MGQGAGFNPPPDRKHGSLAAIFHDNHDNYENQDNYANIDSKATRL